MTITAARLRLNVKKYLTKMLVGWGTDHTRESIGFYVPETCSVLLEFWDQGKGISCRYYIWIDAVGDEEGVFDWETKGDYSSNDLKRDVAGVIGAVMDSFYEVVQDRQKLMRKQTPDRDELKRMQKAVGNFGFVKKSLSPVLKPQGLTK